MFFALLWWLIYDALVFSAFYLMYNFSDELGTTTSGFSVFAVTTEDPNWFFYLGGAVLSIAALLGLIGMLGSGFLMALFLENRTGAVFRPEWIGLFALWFPCLAAVMTVAGCIIAYRKKE